GYRDHEIVSLGAPSAGGLQTQWNFALAAEADFKKYGHYTESPDSLYWLIQIPRQAGTMSFFLAGPTEERVAMVWNRIKSNMKVTEEPKSGTNHSSLSS